MAKDYIEIRKELFEQVKPFIKEDAEINVHFEIVKYSLEIYFAGLDKGTQNALEIINKNYSK